MGGTGCLLHTHTTLGLRLSLHSVLDGLGVLESERPSANGGCELENKGFSFFGPQVEELRGELLAVCLKSLRGLSLLRPKP